MLAWLDWLMRTSLVPGEDRAWLEAGRIGSWVRVVGIREACSTMISQFTQVYPRVIKGTVSAAWGFACCQGLLLGGGLPAATVAKDLLMGRILLLAGRRSDGN